VLDSIFKAQVMKGGKGIEQSSEVPKAIDYANLTSLKQAITASMARGVLHRQTSVLNSIFHKTSIRDLVPSNYA
jgi:hypothetical protein